MTTLVLVDDDPADLAILRNAFDGYSEDVVIETHSSAHDALDWLDQRSSSELSNMLMVTDLNMPVTDGAELIAQVQDRCHPAPVSIVLSTSSRIGDVTRSYEAGANAYHSKPMGFHETTELCHAMLDYWLETTHRPAVRQGPAKRV
jgi:CheY-like chemotaxis protein